MAMDNMYGSWWRVIYSGSSSDKPALTRQILKRVAAYAKPYKKEIGLMFITIVISAVLGAVGPLILMEVIDNALPNGDLGLLTLLSVLLMLVPLVNAAVLVYQRYLNASIGE